MTKLKKYFPHLYVFEDTAGDVSFKSTSSLSYLHAVYFSLFISLIFLFHVNTV